MSKVVLITGASSGIGKSIAEFLLQKGFVVYGTSRNPSKITNSPFKLIELDVTDATSIANATKSIVALEGRIDVLINNAGMGITGPLEETPTEEMRRVFETNFFGAIEMMKAVLPNMRAQQHGLISRAVGGDAVALCPPLIIKEDEINEMFDRLERALDDTEAWVNKENLRAA